MKQFYISNSGKEEGPFSLDELKTKSIKKETLAWTDGMENWQNASDIEELKSLIASETEIKPKPKPKPKPVPKPVPTSNNDDDALGCFIMIMVIIYVVFLIIVGG